MRRLVAVLAGFVLALTLTPPTPATAAGDTATTLLPVDDTDQLETHSWVDCKVAGAHCDFIAGVQLRTPEGVAGFPPDLWARQSTDVRSNKRSTYLDVHTAGGEGPYADRGGPGTKVFKEGGTAVIQSMYNGEGPPEKYQTVGTIDAADWATGQPSTDANIFVCAHVQVVYAGVNLTTPSTCAKTTFS
jgi:hypothetical protein